MSTPDCGRVVLGATSDSDSSSESSESLSESCKVDLRLATSNVNNLMWP